MIDIKQIVYEGGFILLGIGFVLQWLTDYSWTKLVLGFGGLLLLTSVIFHLGKFPKTKGGVLK